MKKLMIAAFAIMLSGSTIALKASDGDKYKIANLDNSEKGKSPKVGITVTVYFGHGDGCLNRGICRIGVAVTSVVIATYDGDGNGTLTIQVPEEYIVEHQPDKLQYFTGQTKFIVEEEYALSQDICTKLGTHENLVIKPGTYKMNFLDGIYTIIIGDML